MLSEILMLDNFRSMVLGTIMLNNVAHSVFNLKIHNVTSDVSFLPSPVTHPVFLSWAFTQPDSKEPQRPQTKAQFQDSAT